MTDPTIAEKIAAVRNVRALPVLAVSTDGEWDTNKGTQRVYGRCTTIRRRTDWGIRVTREPSAPSPPRNSMTER